MERHYGIPQDESLVAHSPWRDQSDFYLNWSLTAQEISRTINALGPPYDGAKAYLNGEHVKIPDASHR